jgi:peptidoglycan/LPS O-acetylase OafA/YrhL
MRRIAGLDSIRFLCALTVLFYHQPNPLTFWPALAGTHPGRLLIEFYSDLCNGQAAVIVFFVISGFCIHYPYTTGRSFTASPFLLGRVVRIMIPVCAYFLLIRVTGFTKPVLTVLLWSVWCELIYYGLYPLLRITFARTSVKSALLASYLPALAVAIYVLEVHGYAEGYFSVGGLTWLVGLPCWLLGCLLAERFEKSVHPKAATPWAYRAGALALSVATHYAMRNLHVSFLFSLNAFAVFCYFWLRAELRWYSTRPPIGILERLGVFTYSLYLMHALAGCMWESLVGGHGIALWSLEIGFALLVSTTFFGLVEWPSHLLARRLSRRPD